MISLFMKKQTNNNNSGFSLIEVIVALGLIALIAGLIIANYREGERTNTIHFSAKDLATTLRQAQNNSLGAVRYDGRTPAGGWGVHIDLETATTSYKLFANLDYDEEDIDTYGYEAGQALPEHGGKTMDTKRGTFIATTSLGSMVSISFLPPHPETLIFDGTATSSEVEILLENEAGETRKVEVNSLGLIKSGP